ncbi:MAG: ATP-binding cassette domain-containing protein [Gammaproteobacteria bacterium]|nr:ATP-binding cassette domain-containing protein [Gammaproteobacteria bacterium]
MAAVNPPLLQEPSSQGPLLQTQGLSHAFGGIQAVDDVDLTVNRGDIHALIGPNGAGKTTLVSMICGRLRATGGRIEFLGEDISRERPWTRVARGIVYTFQVTSVFGGLTVLDNVMLAAQRRHLRGWERVFGNRLLLENRARQALTALGLEGYAKAKAAALPYGHQRLLEVAMALALEPGLLILDEPTQGLAEADIAAMCECIRKVAQRATVLLIEHNMTVVLNLSTRITVMDRGRIIAEGEPAQIEANERVQAAYLGTGAVPSC